MTELNNTITLTVSEISYLLMLGPKRFSKGMVSGREIHKKLLFNQARVFARYHQVDDGGWILIVGKPDRLKFEKNRGVVEELKTFLGKEQKKVQEKVGFFQAQLYCWLTGLPFLRLYLYDIEEKKIIKTLAYQANLFFVSEAIQKAFEIKTQIDLLDHFVVKASYLESDEQQT